MHSRKVSDLFPTRLYGTVSLEGANAPEGTPVSVWINGQLLGETTVRIVDDEAVFHLDVAGDVDATRRQSRPVASRSVDERSWSIKLIHEPSGLTVAGEVPLGNYSKQEMQEARNGLTQRLWRELEQKVAKHLRLPGW